jgi:hypothetical protein
LPIYEKIFNLIFETGFLPDIWLKIEHIFHRNIGLFFSPYPCLKIFNTPSDQMFLDSLTPPSKYFLVSRNSKIIKLVGKITSVVFHLK